VRPKKQNIKRQDIQVSMGEFDRFSNSAFAKNILNDNLDVKNFNQYDEQMESPNFLN